MRVDFVRVLATLAAGAFVGLTSSASAAVKEHCGSVSYTYPGTDGHGHGALNNLTAVNVSCAKARNIAKAFLITHKAPEHWRARTKVAVIHGTAVGEEIFTQGRARVVGDQAG